MEINDISEKLLPQTTKDTFDSPLPAVIKKTTKQLKKLSKQIQNITVARSLS